MILFMKHYNNSNSWTGTGWYCSWSTTTTATVGQALDDTVHEALQQQQQLDRHWMILFMKHYNNSNSWTGIGWYCSWSTTTTATVGQALDDTVHEALQQQQQLDRHWMILFMKHYDNSNSWTGTGWYCSWSTTTTATVGQALDDTVHEALRLNSIIQCLSNCCCCRSASWTVSSSACPTVAVVVVLHEQCHPVPVQLLLLS